MENYRNKISGPLLDRIDIHLEAPAVEFRDLSSEERAEPSSAIRERVVEVRVIQQKRFGSSKTRANAGMSHSQIKAHCKLDSTGQELLGHAMEELHLSARAYDRILKVSRTIADQAGACDGGHSVSDAGSEFVALKVNKPSLTPRPLTISSTRSKSFKFTVTGKHVSSAGYNITIDAIKLVK